LTFSGFKKAKGLPFRSRPLDEIACCAGVWGDVPVFSTLNLPAWRLLSKSGIVVRVRFSFLLEVEQGQART
jgi:hypothetical protein